MQYCLLAFDSDKLLCVPVGSAFSWFLSIIEEEVMNETATVHGAGSSTGSVSWEEPKATGRVELIESEMLPSRVFPLKVNVGAP